jgi:hypothetical protein
VGETRAVGLADKGGELFEEDTAEVGVFLVGANDIRGGGEGICEARRGIHLEVQIRRKSRQDIIVMDVVARSRYAGIHAKTISAEAWDGIDDIYCGPLISPSPLSFITFSHTSFNSHNSVHREGYTCKGSF